MRNDGGLDISINTINCPRKCIHKQADSTKAEHVIKMFRIACSRVGMEESVSIGCGQAQGTAETFDDTHVSALAHLLAREI